MTARIEREVTMRERERLGRELHDSLDPNMCALALQLSSADSIRR